MREMQKASVALRPFGALNARTRSFLVSGVLGVFFGVIGPFSTYAALDLPLRLVYWLAIMIGANGIIVGMFHLHDRWRPEALPLWQRHLAMAVLGAIPVSVLVLVVTYLCGLGLFSWRGLVGLYISVLSVTVATLVVMALVSRAFDRAEAPSVEPAAPENLGGGAGKPLLAGHLPTDVPAALRAAPLIALQAEDHYVRVITDKGEALVLMRLKDAVIQLAGADGARVHRSHWVARRGIAAVERKAERLHLRLTTGQRVPVSRSYAADLRAKGWI